MCVCVCVRVSVCVRAQSLQTLCNLMNCCWPGFSFGGLFQTRMGGLPFLTQGDLPKIRMKTASLVSFIGKCISYHYTI